MGSVVVVVGHTLLEDELEMSTTDDQYPIEAIATDRPNKPFGERIRPWCPHRCADDADAAVRPEGFVETRCELRVTVTDQEPDGMPALIELHTQVSRLLDDRRSGRVDGNPVRCTRRLSSSMKNST